MRIKVEEGNYSVMGVVQKSDKVIFTFECEKEDSCNLVMIDKMTKKKQTIPVPEEYCLGSLRSISLKGINIRDYWYYYEIKGEKVIDPYATLIHGREKWNDISRQEDSYEVLCGCTDNEYDWGKDLAPEISRQDMSIYKLHVRGFSKDNRNSKSAGTFNGIKNRINYIRELGFTSVEIMPAYEFEEMEIPPVLSVPDYVKWKVEKEDTILPVHEPKTSDKINYWGYGKGNYFAVKASYAQEPSNASSEFKDLIKCLHRNNMECIMEIFFTEGLNHNLIIEVLRHWVKEYHVDGFHLLGNNLPITAIVQDVMLSRTKILYTGFDENKIPAKNTYKNLFVYKDEYLYPARKILNHMNGEMREVLNQQRKQGNELGYINYITSNNGYTLADLFMYNDRHNEANGENNMDGNPWNFSNNYGLEGPTRKRYISEIRKLKWRNAMMMLYLAQGVPLIWSGDEIGNSQEGNNNAYCQDNKVGWINWKNDKVVREKLDFFKKLSKFRKEHPIISQASPFRFNDYKSLGAPDLSYHGDNAWISDYELNRLTVGLMYCGKYAPKDSLSDYVYVGYNFFSGRNMLALPELPKGMKWYLVADSSDNKEPFKSKEVELENQEYVQLEPQSISIIIGR